MTMVLTEKGKTEDCNAIGLLNRTWCHEAAPTQKLLGEFKL